MLYVLLAGADFGGGVWDLLARAATRGQRALIEHAIAPIWEANHVWLILVVVVLFTAFPPPSRRLTRLHVPLMPLLWASSSAARRSCSGRPGRPRRASAVGGAASSWRAA